MDDTGSAAEKDTLVDISFYVPATSRVYEAIKDVGEEKSAAQVFTDLLKERADLGGSTDESIATFNDVTCLVPRLKFDIFLGYLLDPRLIFPRSHHPHAARYTKSTITSLYYYFTLRVPLCQ
eukprot:3751811-Pyramimonas_sp.AAC.1